jgi:hypothetical protein
VYLAFRLAVEDTLSDIELQQDLDDGLDFPLGFLTEVPILEQVPLHVQVDLLAETWNRHRRNQSTTRQIARMSSGSGLQVGRGVPGGTWLSVPDA